MIAALEADRIILFGLISFGLIPASISFRHACVGEFSPTILSDS